MNAELKQTIEASKKMFEESLDSKQIKLKQAFELAQKNTKKAKEEFLNSLTDSQKKYKILYEQAIKTFHNAKEAAQNVINTFKNSNNI